MSVVSFSSTVLSGKGKTGLLPPDSDGYYTLPVGGLNVHNSAGDFYILDGAKELFQNSSFLRRVQNGALKGEVGHPVREPNMRDDQFLDRFLTIRETNICCHFSEVWLDEKSMRDKRGNPIVAIMAKVKPSGPMGHVLKESLENQKENFGFSVRGFTKDIPNGQNKLRLLKTIITFDYVLEPGIEIATKFNSPALEDLTTLIDKPLLPEVFKAYEKKTMANGMVLESSKILKEELSWINDKDQPYTPVYRNW